MSWQSNVFTLANEIGYQSDPSGVCHGVSHMAIQAALVGELDTFSKRYELIQKISPEEFSAQIETINEKFKNNQNPALSDDERMILDIRAFFEGVEIYFGPDRYGELLGGVSGLSQNSVMQVAPVVSSQKLEELGGLVENGKVTGIYDANSLATLLTDLKEQIHNQGFDDQYPVAMSLMSYNHTMALMYDAKERKWAFVNPDAKPVILADEQAVADYIIKGFPGKENNMSAFTIATYSTGKNQKKVDALVSAWRQSAGYKNANEFSFQHAKQNDKSGISPLMVAAINNDAESFNALLAAGASPEIVDDNGHSVMLHAVKDGSYKIVEALLDYGVGVDYVAPGSDKTMLMDAVSYGQIGVAELLVSKGADVNIKDNNGVSPLITAAKNGDARLMSVLLQSKTADMNAVDKKGNTPLMAAIDVHAKTNDEVAGLLLHKGADPNIANNYGVTPLIAAIERRSPLIVNQLLGSDSTDVNKPDKDGTSPLMYAVADIVNDDDDLQIFNQLVASPKVNVNQVDEEGKSVIFKIINNSTENKSEMLKSLLKREDIDVNAKDSKGNSPLHYAVKNGDLAAVKMLIENGASLDIKNEKGMTPLQYAQKLSKKDKDYPREIGQYMESQQIVVSRSVEMSRREKERQQYKPRYDQHKVAENTNLANKAEKSATEQHSNDNNNNEIAASTYRRK